MATFSHRHSQLFFKLVAPIYDLAVGAGISSRARQALQLLGDIRGKTALDVCTGTGLMAMELASAGACVTGVDASLAMLQQAESKLDALNVRLLQASAADLPFPDSSFDVVTVSMGLHELPATLLAQAVSELRRVAREHVLVIDWISRPRGRLARWGVALVERVEGSNYQEFVDTDLPMLLQKSGLTPVHSQSMDTIGAVLCRKH